MTENRDIPAPESSEIKFDGNLLELPSDDTQLASKVGEALAKKLKLLGWGDHDAGNAELVLSELLINLMKYGNKGDHQKKVFIEIKQLDLNKVVVSMRDQSGIFFEPTNQEEKALSTEGLLAEGGRGIFLARGFSDSLVYSRWPGNPDEEIKGTEVTFQVSNKK